MDGRTEKKDYLYFYFRYLVLFQLDLARFSRGI